MRGVLLVLLLVCGCGRLEFQREIDGGSVRLDAGRDAMMMIADAGDAGTILDSGADGGRPDRDRDTKPDDIDNCPDVPNLDQYNEDADRFGDACDPCPPYADDTPADGDGDGVGDECDPDPAMGGDRILVFEGFNGGIPAGWVVDGNWTITGGRLSAASGVDLVEHVFTARVLGARDWIGTHVSIDTIHGTEIRNAGLISMNTPAQDGILCAPGKKRNSAGGEEAIYLIDVDSGVPLDMAAVAFTAGQGYHLAWRRNGTNYVCNGEPAGSATVSTNGTYTPSPAEPRIGMRATSVGATFNWFMIATGG